MDRSKEIVRVSIAGILVNLFLVAVKAVIGFLARSTSVLLDAVNNFSDPYRGPKETYRVSVGTADAWVLRRHGKEGGFV